MKKLTRDAVIRKCLHVMDAIRRAMSLGESGLVPMPGKEEEFEMDDEICAELRQILREMQQGKSITGQENKADYDWMKDYGKIRKQMAEETEENKPVNIRDWQKEIMENGIPERMELK